MDLKTLYIFEGLSEEELAYFSLMIQNEEFDKGEIIIKEGDECNDVAYIIEQGEVEIIKGGEKIATLGNGEIFGEIALITHEPRTATVKTTVPTKVVKLFKDEFMMLYERSGKYSEIKEKIFKRIQNNFYGIVN